MYFVAVTKRGMVVARGMPGDERPHEMGFDNPSIFWAFFLASASLGGGGPRSTRVRRAFARFLQKPGSLLWSDGRWALLTLPGLFFCRVFQCDQVGARAFPRLARK